ncbi:MAG: hypothetical protein GXO21_04255 [Aquificae bacterium]|nr:hypothetical protein [Aquificota bacterium]
MKGLKKVLEERSKKGKSVNLKFTPQIQGICEFCGEERELSNKIVLEKIKGSSHPGISKSQEGLPFICEDCSFVYSVISATRPSEFFGDRYILVVEDDKYYFLEDINQIKQMPEGRYFFIYSLINSNYLPINFYDMKPTINPKKNLIINYTAGSSFETFEIETDRFFELLDSDSKEIHLINSIRKKYSIKGAR